MKKSIRSPHHHLKGTDWWVGETYETPAGLGTFQYPMENGKLIFRIPVTSDMPLDRCMTSKVGKTGLFWFLEKELK